MTPAAAMSSHAVHPTEYATPDRPIPSTARPNSSAEESVENTTRRTAVVDISSSKDTPSASTPKDMSWNRSVERKEPSGSSRAYLADGRRSRSWANTECGSKVRRSVTS